MASARTQRPPANPRWAVAGCFFSVLAGACQFGTAWAGLRLNSFIQHAMASCSVRSLRPLLR